MGKKTHKEEKFKLEKGLNMVMENKTVAVLALLILFSGSALADSISNYTVPNNIPLNDTLTIYGKYNTGSDVLCAFYIFDLQNNDLNRALIRLNDQYTFSDNSFYNEIKITEPLFRRGIDYNAITKCGTTEIGKKFTVTQSEQVLPGKTADSLKLDWAFWTSGDNSITVVMTLLAVLFLAGIAYLGLKNMGWI